MTQSLTEKTLGARIYTPVESQVLRRLSASNFMAYRRRLLSGSLTLLEVQSLLKIPSPQLTLLIEEGHFLCMKDGRGQLKLPSWQFDPTSEDYLLPGLKQVLTALGKGPLAAILWLTTTRSWLSGHSAIEAIKTGDYDVVLDHVNDEHDLVLS